MIRLKNISGMVYPVSLALTILLSLFSIKAVPYAIATLILIWVLWERDFSNPRLKFQAIWPYFMYCLVFVMGYLFSNDMATAVKSLEKITSFFLFPFLIAYAKWDRKRYVWFSQTFILSLLAVCLLSMVLLGFFVLENKEFVSQMDESYLQWKLPHLMGYHPTYMGMLIVCATILLTTFFFETPNKVKKRYVVAIILSLTVFLVYLSQRMAVFLQLGICFYFVFRVFHKKKVFSIPLIFLGTIIFTFLILKSNYLIDKILRSITDDRFFLWQYAYGIIKENYFFFGEGLGEGRKALNTVLNEIADPRVSYRGLDLHNQYLKNYLELGLFGLLGLLLLIARPLALKTKSIPLTLFLIVFGISMMTESTLSLIKGIVMFNIMSLVLIRQTFTDYGYK